MTEAGSPNQNDELKHQSVLLTPALELLNIRSGLTYVDVTVGAGGHLRGIVQALAKADSALAGHSATAATVQAGTVHGVIGIDRDNRSLEAVRKLVAPSEARLFHANYTDLKEVAAQAGVSTITGGILADLGVSSMQIDNPERGFSFQKDGPLDMRMDETQYLTAYEIVNKWDEKQLADTIYEYGEERQSRSIARNIVNARPLKTTLELAEVVARSARHHGKHNRHTHSIHPATRTFQALRIAVNDELGGLRKFLQEAISLLAPGARASHNHVSQP